VGVRRTHAGGVRAHVALRSGTAAAVHLCRVQRQALRYRDDAFPRLKRKLRLVVDLLFDTIRVEMCTVQVFGEDLGILRRGTAKHDLEPRVRHDGVVVAEVLGGHVLELREELVRQN